MYLRVYIYIYIYIYVLDSMKYAVSACLLLPVRLSQLGSTCSVFASQRVSVRLPATWFARCGGGSKSTPRRSKIDPRRSQNRVKIVTCPFPPQLKLAQERQEAPQSAPRHPKCLPRGPRSAPRAPQERPKSAPRAPKSAPGVPKSVPRAAQERPETPQRPLGTPF